jgi:hypothetical protein
MERIIAMTESNLFEMMTGGVRRNRVSFQIGIGAPCAEYVTACLRAPPHGW